MTHAHMALGMVSLKELKKKYSKPFIFNYLTTGVIEWNLNKLYFTEFIVNSTSLSDSFKDTLVNQYLLY